MTHSRQRQFIIRQGRLLEREAGPANGWRRLAAAALAGLIAGAAGCQPPPEPEVYPGPQIRTERVSEQSSPFLKAAVCEGVDSQGRPMVRMEKWERVLIRERPVYQVVNLYADPGDLNRDHHRYERVPDQEIAGKPTVRRENRRLGVLANSPVGCGGSMLRTDAEGILHLPRETVLRPFDDVNRRTLRLEFVHRDHSPVAMSIARKEVWSLLGIPCRSGGRRSALSSANGVRLRVEAPSEVPSGGTAIVRLVVENRGPGRLYNVRGRLFSRCGWISGPLFYIGDVMPGERRGFQRRVDVPSARRSETCFARLGIRHAGGPIREPVLSLELTARAAGANAGKQE